MDVDPPDRQCSCSRRTDLESTIVAEDACIVNFSQIIDCRPDTEQNAHLKDIVRKQVMEQKKFNSNSKNPSPMPEEPKIIAENHPIINKNIKSAEDNPLPKRKPKKKRKKPKTSTDDFVFPKKTA
ncbi:hypothetical protein TNCT_729551 [Trichonephila clavata]|uniref:Uncharacterized protein n=1 Tax=Trichonephila clavata TaxID=2740835 RepID=A0A8X6LWJ6_TRICU|nr:hypothetical protein TNCT_729551 [Trichonephila clavata]